MFIEYKNRQSVSLIRRYQYLIVLFLIAIFFLLTLLSSLRMSVTVDEFAHLPAGYLYLKEKRFDVYRKNPPLLKMITALPLILLKPRMPGIYGEGLEGYAWLPWYIGTNFMYLNSNEYLMLFFTGRLMIILLACGLGLLIYFWSRALFGIIGATISLSLFSFSPIIIAHAGLATLDIGTAFFLALHLFLLYKFYKTNYRRYVIFSSLTLGLILAVRYNMWLMLPIDAIIIFLIYSQGDSLKNGHIIKVLKVIVIRVVIAVLIINSIYLFKGSSCPLNSFRFISPFIQKSVSVLPQWLPVPLPKDYIKGFDELLLDVKQGEFPQYMRGKWREGRLPFYYLYAFLIKTSLASLILSVIGIGIMVFYKGMAFINKVILILPISAFFILYTLFSGLAVGVRYLLPVYPLLFILAGACAVLMKGEWGRCIAMLLIGLLIFHISGTIFNFPDYLSYFNGLIGGPGNGHLHLLDSNIDWGQGLIMLKEYMDQKGLQRIHLIYFGSVDPSVYGIDYRFVMPSQLNENPPEVIAISINYLQGMPYPVIYKADYGKMPMPVPILAWHHNILPIPMDAYAYLRENYHVIDHIGHSIVILERGKK